MQKSHSVVNGDLRRSLATQRSQRGQYCNAHNESSVPEFRKASAKRFRGHFCGFLAIQPNLNYAAEL